MDDPRPPQSTRIPSRAAWRAARTFDELCALGAEFVAGRSTHFPGWGAPDVDVETDAIAARLVELNVRGFLTVASQPGIGSAEAGDTTLQRAFVAGFARRELARALARSTRIAVRAWTRDGLLAASSLGATRSAATGSERAEEAESMTTVDGVARVVLGHPARDDELELFADEIGDEALRELESVAYVAAWDPQFGRADLLWDELIRLAAS